MKEEELPRPKIPTVWVCLIFSPFVDSLQREQNAFSRYAYVHFTEEDIVAPGGAPPGAEPWKGSALWLTDLLLGHSFCFKGHSWY